MSEPTIRELLDQAAKGVGLERVLAARVEAVLAYCEGDKSPRLERQSLVRQIRRLLDGEAA